MKTNNLLAILYGIILLPYLSLAQPPSPDEYEVVTIEDPLEQFYGNKYPGYYITKDGSRTDCLILFEKGNKLNSYNTPLTTALAYQGPTTTVDKNNLSAFLVKNRLYVPAKVNDVEQWVNITQQGAIKQIKKATYTKQIVEKKLEFWYDKEKETNVGYWDTLKVSKPYWSETGMIQKLNNVPEVILILNKKNLLKLVGDYPEMATKVENKEKGYKNSLTDLNFKERIFNEYNTWYDAQHPGEITYYPTEATFVAPDKPLPNTTAKVSAKPVEEQPSDYEKEIIAAAEKAHRAPRYDPFKNRPTTASAAVASAKPEVAVKKESFKDRLNRIKADGNKVGVLVTSKNIVINPNDFAEGISKAVVMGSYEPLTGVEKLAEQTAQQLNDGFGVDVFEPVEYSQIPVKEGKYGKIDDWWATKYKVIVLYELKPYYNAYYKTINAETGEKAYFAQMRVDSEMIVKAAEDAKPDKLKWVTSSPKTWGVYRSEKKELPGDTDFNIIQELKAAIAPPPDEEIINELISSQKPSVAKFIKKKSK